MPRQLPRRNLVALALATLAAGAVLTRGCVTAPDTHWAAVAPGDHATTAPGAADRAAPPAIAALPPLPSRKAPAKPFGVGVRELSLSRGPDRPLPTTVWYPDAGPAGGDPQSGTSPAVGRFPLILLSHGLNGEPEQLAPVATRWASAGFVVAAPAYPHTRREASRFDVLDVVNQPADASYVISQVLALDGHDGDPLAGRLDTAAVAATGYSAGGITTTGLLSTQRDIRLRAAVVIAGALLGGSYAGPATPVLFVHGDADPTVAYSGGQAAYQAMRWPKAFLTLEGADHGRYLTPASAGFDPLVRTTTDFLRWTLYGDTDAKGRLSRDGTLPGTSRWESAL
ncbi:alpha/beta hydrolase family protein [Planosporangium sp. 12N6]|uniref:alpha/beta hydrolase family protein n=1 Tax=Planosporangium spinosum TaxID=3402278 RepID=UPI003CF412A7